jgi:hypothetical protein
MKRALAFSRIPALLAATIALAACDRSNGEWSGTMVDSAGIAVVHNPSSARWTLRAEPRLVEELRIGALDGAPELQFGQIAAIDVAADGTMYVLDAQAAQVRIFDAQGRFVRAVGRPGGGPGEVSPAAAAVLAGEDGTVYIADVMRQRIAAFGADGAEIGSTSMPMQQGIPVRWEITRDRRFAVQLRSMPFPGMTNVVMRDRIVTRDPGSERADTLLEMESGRTFEVSGGMPRMRLFESEPVWALLPDGRLARATNDAFRVEIIGRGGGVERVLTMPFERRPLGDGDRDAFRRLLREAISQQAPPAAVEQILQNLEFADHYPAFATFAAGPAGTLWVQRIRTASDVEAEGGRFDAQDIGSPVWDIFDEKGRLLGNLRMPDGFTPLRFVGSLIYGVLRDDLDVPHVARLRVEGW